MEEDDLDLDLNEDSANDFNFNDWGGDYNQSPSNKQAGLLKELTDLDPVLKNRVASWLGLVYDEDEQKYIKKRDAIINEAGAEWAVGFLKTYMSKSNFITNISQEEFKNIQLDIIQVVWLVFPTIDEFGIKSNADYYRLCTELDNSAFLILAGAGDGKYTKFFGDSVQRTEHINLSPGSMQTMQQMPQLYQAKKIGIIQSVKNKLLGR